MSRRISTDGGHDLALCAERQAKRFSRGGIEEFDVAVDSDLVRAARSPSGFHIEHDALDQIDSLRPVTPVPAMVHANRKNVRSCSRRRSSRHSKAWQLALWYQ
jgi:hypothetical protein